MNSKSNIFYRGFTLIELLLVIAIIALLSSIILASVSSARDKAQMTQNIAFHKNIEKELTLVDVGSKIIEWNFDDAADPIVVAKNRQLINTYDATPTGTIPKADGVDGKSSMHINATGKYVLASVPLTFDEITVSAFINPEVASSYDSIVSSTAFNFTKTNYDALAVSFSGFACIAAAGANPTVELMNNEWTHVAFSYDGANVRLYINGDLIKTCPKTGSFSTTQIQVGYNSVSGIGNFEPYVGKIDNVQVYTKAYIE